MAEAAGDERFALELVEWRWDELEPWPEAPAVLRDLASDHRLALVHQHVRGPRPARGARSSAWTIDDA